MRLGRAGAMLLCCVGCGYSILCAGSRDVCAEVCFNFFCFGFSQYRNDLGRCCKQHNDTTRPS